VANSMYFREDLRGGTGKIPAPSWEVNHTSSCQDVTGTLWKTLAPFSIQNGPPVVATQSQINAVHSHPSYSLQIQFNIILPPSKLSLAFMFTYWNFVCISDRYMCATCLTHLMPFHLITVIFGNNSVASHYVIFSRILTVPPS
jgi:hypothetical protein